MRNMTELTGGLLALALVFMAATAGAADLPKQWTKDYEAALAKAEETGKPVLAVFSTSWCGPCQHMVRNVYPQEKTIAALEEWVPVYVDGDEHRDLVGQHGVSAYPTFVMLASTGDEIGRMVGGAGDADGFLARVDQAVKDGRAIVAAREQLQSDPDNPALHRQLGVALLETNEKAGMEHLKKALAIDPDATGGIPDGVLEAVRAEIRFDRDLAAINARLEANGDDPALYKARGDLYAQDRYLMGDGMGKIEQGLADYRKAAELDPENKTGAATEVRFFDLLMESPDDPAEFIRELDAFVAANAGHQRVALARFVSALVTLQAGNPDAGVEKMKAFLASHPDHEMAEQVAMMLSGMGVTVEPAAAAHE